MERLTVDESEGISSLLLIEGLACKKCRAYSNTLTDPLLAEALKSVAEGHEERFAALYSLLEGAL